MKDVRIRRLPTVDDPFLQGRPCDYSDAFEVRLTSQDGRTAEQWARAALEDMPPILRRLVLVVHRQVLRLQLGPLDSTEHILGWRVASRAPDRVRLEADGPLLCGVMVAGQPQPDVLVITTCLSFGRKRTAAVAWLVVGMLHRCMAPYLLKRAATTRNATGKQAGSAPRDRVD